MDLGGAVGLGGLVGSETGFVPLATTDPETKHKRYGYGVLKQERSGTVTEDEYFRSSKLAKTDDDDNSASKAMLFHQRNSLLRSNNVTLFSDGQNNQQQQMLSFSSPKSESLLVDKSSPNATFSYSFHPLSSSYNKNTGYNSGSMHGIFAGTRGPFTPSQWMELEHQALIYKYLTANVPVPSHLLIPIKKALESAGFCNFSSGLLKPNAMGWGGFHLGYSNNTDPEPGRCRRTDGKKWRCSRDAVVDQKYCERHMNRGRHRSRKLVEGQSGHAVTNTPTTITNANANANANAKSSSSLPPVVPGSGTTASNSLTFARHEIKNMHHPLASDTSSASPNNTNRMFMNNNNNKDNGKERIPNADDALPMLPSTLELKPKENPFMIHKQQIPYEESSRNEFGFVTCDSLLSPSNKDSTLMSSNSRSFGSLQNPIDREPDSQHSLRQFIDDWPKTQSINRSGVVSWPESERTELSISIPMTSTDEKVTLSPLRLSGELELDPIQMGLGVGNAINNSSRHAATNWVPIAWESSAMGGPLGEVLNLSNNNINNANDHHCVNNNNSSALNLMTDGWDNSPPTPIGSSPTGVLQKTAFGSLSNSSAGSSPRAENNRTQQEGASLCNDLLGSNC